MACLFGLIFNVFIVKGSDGQILHDTIPAPSLKNNIIGEDTMKTIVVYLPPSYEGSEEKFPVLYFLPGWTCDYIKDDLLPNYMNYSLMYFNINEFIVVKVPGCNAFDGTFYGNSVVIGNWEDFIAKDVVSYVDANFRTIDDPASRGIGGHSMGGYGAMNLAMKNPSIFGLTYGLSSGLATESGFYTMDAIDTTKEFVDQYLELDAYLSTLGRKEALEILKDTIYKVRGMVKFAVAYGAAFAPDTVKNAPYSKYPWSYSGNELVRDTNIWNEWESGFANLDNKIAMYNDSLAKLILIANEYSTKDHYAWIIEGCQYFSQKLDDAGIPNVLLTYSGGHRQDDRFRITMLPLMASYFQFDPDYLNNETEVYSMNVDYFKACDIDSLNREVLVTVTEQADISKIRVRTLVTSTGARSSINANDTIDGTSPTTIFVTSENKSNTVEWTLSFHVYVPSGINPELSDNNIGIYPVPVKNELNIDFSNSSSEYKSIQLYTELGQLVYNKQIKEQDRLTINTEGLTMGLYIVKLVSSDRISMHKIIMQ